jgi:hypothetical protein
MADNASDPGYAGYRWRGYFAFFLGALFILTDMIFRFGGMAQNIPPVPISLIGLAILWIGSIYICDLPSIYRRIAELENRLEERIDALSKAAGGNGKQTTSEN